MMSLSVANSTDSPYKCHCKCQCKEPAVTCVQFPDHFDSVARGSVSRDCLKEVKNCFIKFQVRIKLSLRILL